MILITNGKVITRDPERPYLPDGAVLVDGRYIQAIGPRAELEKAYPAAQRVDAHGGVILIKAGSLAECRAFLAGDPMVVAGASHYRITEFLIKEHAPCLDPLLDGE